MASSYPTNSPSYPTTSDTKTNVFDDEHPKLYTRDSTGKIRVFYMINHNDGTYRSVNGIHEGTMVVSGLTTAKPVNVGHANERNAVAQAAFEIEAEYKKKLKRGYFERIEDVDSGTELFPMLANKYGDLKKGLDWSKSWYAQRKYDGIRAIARPVGVFSRKAEPFPVLAHVRDGLKDIFAEYPMLSFDGEMYHHDLKDDLPKINSIVRKTKNISEEDFAAAKTLQYVLYDVISDTNRDLPYQDRLAMLTDLFNRYLNGNPLFLLAPAVPVQNQKELDDHYKESLVRGYEGQIIRDANGRYDAKKRSPYLLKRKEYIDAEFTVADILEGNGNWSGAAKSVVYHNPHNPGETFETGLAGTYEDNKKILEERDLYIGGPGTVTFFKLSPYAVPVQGVTKILHGREGRV